MNAQLSNEPRRCSQAAAGGRSLPYPRSVFSYEEIKVGNVNHTYKVNYIRDDGTGMARIKSYLVQRVNTYAFQHPVELMRNIDCVTDTSAQSTRRPGACTSTILPTATTI